MTIVTAKDRVTDLDGALDTLNTARMEADENAPMLEKQFDTAELIREYQNDPRFGTSWTMQKAMVCMWTDCPGTTIIEMAYWISIVFEKPNYGIARARVDLRKFKNQDFRCQHAIETATAELTAE